MRLLALSALLALSLAGCGETTTSTCVDWVYFESTDAAAEGSGAVVVGTIGEIAGSREIEGTAADVYLVSVEAVLKGDLEAEVIEVASTPESCGDTIDTSLPIGERVELFLFVSDDGYRTLTPFDAYVPAPAGEPLPWDPALATP